MRDALQAWASTPQVGQSDSNALTEAIAESLRQHTKELKATRLARKRNHSSDSEDELPKQYNCMESLEIYKLTDIPNTHMAKVADMEKIAKKASTAFKARGKYVLQDPVTAFPPLWFQPKDVAKETSSIPTHAHWVAGWWSRAYCQLSGQIHGFRRNS